MINFPFHHEDTKSTRFYFFPLVVFRQLPSRPGFATPAATFENLNNL